VKGYDLKKEVIPPEKIDFKDERFTESYYKYELIAQKLSHSKK